MQKIVIVFVFLLFSTTIAAQNTEGVFFKFTTAQNRAKFYNGLLKNTITKNLSLPITDSTEENWMDAFSAMELIYYKDAWAIKKLDTVALHIDQRSAGLQQSFIELIYALKNKMFTRPVKNLLNTTPDGKIFAMCAEYLLMADTSVANQKAIISIAQKRMSSFAKEQNLQSAINLIDHLQAFNTNKKATPSFFKPLFKKDYLRGSTVVYSIQNKNRDLPGFAVIKDTAGNFIKDSTGAVIAITQLARSLSNMPGYLTNGNTPQGIFRLFSFDKSRSNFIGPTENLQLTMPYETSLKHFLKDSSIADTAWSVNWYLKLLPAALQNYYPLQESFYASSAGRTEIIAHGTAVDASFYQKEKYFPYTPTAGCLCTEERWNADGWRVVSDQQRLADAVKKAGGADGYLIVIEIDGLQKAVSLSDILPVLP